MRKNLAVVFYYKNLNKFSFNALLGAAETREGLKGVKIFLPEKETDFLSETEDCLKKYERVIAGISLCIPQAQEAGKLVKKLKSLHVAGVPARNAALLCVAGGPYPTGRIKETLAAGFDVVVAGEGEETFVELLEKYAAGEDFRKIEGIAYPDAGTDGGFKQTPSRKFIDLDSYPPIPANSSIYGTIEISRGCAFGCYFCQTPYIFGRRLRHRSVEKICASIEQLAEKNRTDIRFICPSAFSYGSPDGRNLNLPELEKLLSSIRNIIRDEGRIFLGTFPSEVRPEQVSRETLGLLKKYADNDNIIIGAQSGSQRVLDSCHRGHTVEDIYNAVRLTVGAGLGAYVDFIVGLPGETEKDKAASRKVMNDLIKLGAKIRPHKFMPLPQTPFGQ